jgi:rubredoxin
MGGADCGGRDEATEERGVEGSRRWGQRRGRWKVRECGVEGKEGGAFDRAAGTKWEERET